MDETTKVTIGYKSEYDHLKEGQYYITISCNADCNPECLYHFYRNEQLVHKVDGTISVLAGRNMSGQYTCLAKNSIMKTYKISTNFADISIKCMFKKCFLLRLKVICVFNVCARLYTVNAIYVILGLIDLLFRQIRIFHFWLF